MTYAPETIKDVQEYMHERTGLDWVSLGIIGSKAHKQAGTSYHLGEDDLKLGKRPYSVYESKRDIRGLSDAAAALDVGHFDELRKFSIWLVGECERGAEDTLDIREIIYSPDGEHVKRWDREGERDDGDDSHLSHTHISWYRDGEGRSKLGPFKRYFEGRKPAPSKPSKPAKPAPGPAVAFPLPSGFYFGPKSGPAESVSGHYPRTFKGRQASEWLKAWAAQLERRGWSVGEGRRYLSGSGNDGRYGPEYAALIAAFQRDQNLDDDEKLGRRTWDAAYKNPVTG